MVLSPIRAKWTRIQKRRLCRDGRRSPGFGGSSMSTERQRSEQLDGSDKSHGQRRPDQRGEEETPIKANCLMRIKCVFLIRHTDRHPLTTWPLRVDSINKHSPVQVHWLQQMAATHQTCKCMVKYADRIAVFTHGCEKMWPTRK